MVDWWIPIVAGFVGGLLPAVVAVYSQAKQSEDRNSQRLHELDLATTRHEHERAQSLRSEATKAYASLVAAVERMHPALFDTVEGDNDGADRIVDQVDDAYARAHLALSTVRLHGWSSQIRDLAKDARQALKSAYNDYYRHWMLITFREPASGTESTHSAVRSSEERLSEQRQLALDLAEALADAIGV